MALLSGLQGWWGGGTSFGLLSQSSSWALERRQGQGLACLPLPQLPRGTAEQRGWKPGPVVVYRPSSPRHLLGWPGVTVEGILGDLRESDVTAISLFLQLGNRTYFGLSWGLKASGQWLPLIKVSVSIRAGFTSGWGSVHSEPRQNASCRQRGACFSLSVHSWPCSPLETQSWLLPQHGFLWMEG